MEKEPEIHPKLQDQEKNSPAKDIPKTSEVTNIQNQMNPKIDDRTDSKPTRSATSQIAMDP